jgi:hypothetical protein
MCFARKYMGVLCSVCLVLPIFAQQTSTSAAQSVQRDPQALLILSQALNAAGGVQAISAIQDFTANGTITYYWDDAVSGSATVEGRGQGQFRIDATLPDGVRRIVANNGTGSVTESDGSVRSMPHEVASALGSMTFPYSTLLAAVGDPSVTIAYVGIVDHNGSEVHQIRVQRTYPNKAHANGQQTALTVRDIFIDPNSFVVVSVLNMVSSGGDSEGIPREVLFANYQVAGGVAVPFQITEKVRDQSLCALQLTQIVFNTGLTDQTFSQ